MGWRRKKPKQNLLDLCPCLNSRFVLKKYQAKPFLVIPRTGWIEQIGVKYLRQSPEHRYELDDLGCFVLERCTGAYRVKDIEKEVENTFGEKAAPTLPRLVKFLQILDNNHVITFKENLAFTKS